MFAGGKCTQKEERKEGLSQKVPNTQENVKDKQNILPLIDECIAILLLCK
jgi:hypothetical protein